MATVEMVITFKHRGAAPVERTFTLDSDDMPLILAEAMDEGKIGLMREAITEYLDLSDAESKQLTVRNLKQIGEALKAASDIPKAK